MPCDTKPTQLQAVRMVMADLNWWTPWEIREQMQKRWRLYASDSAVTARLRDLRKPMFGGYVVEKRKGKNGAGWYEYRLAIPEQVQLPLEVQPLEAKHLHSQ